MDKQEFGAKRAQLLPILEQMSLGRFAVTDLPKLTALLSGEHDKITDKEMQVIEQRAVMFQLAMKQQPRADDDDGCSGCGGCSNHNQDDEDGDND